MHILPVGLVESKHMQFFWDAKMGWMYSEKTESIQMCSNDQTCDKVEQHPMAAMPLYHIGQSEYQEVHC